MTPAAGHAAEPHIETSPSPPLPTTGAPPQTPLLNLPQLPLGGVPRRGWMAGGLLIYLCRGHRHSKVATGELATGATPGTQTRDAEDQQASSAP
ncbi:hypothetical protein GCM10009574_086440 [Streptomyces asiaticus]